MTLIKSVLLGSAATLVVVAGAQAADLPTKKGAPAAEYVKVCKIGGIAGFVLPGSDTCLKISGSLEAMATADNLTNNRFTYTAAGVTTFNPRRYDNDFGLSARADIGFEAVSNTAYGPLISVMDMHFDSGEGANIAFTAYDVNSAYIQWAGLTMGVKNSFYDYIAGGETWFNAISPDHTGTGVPLFAYTATFGGGFSATIAVQSNTNIPAVAESVGTENFYHYGAQGPLGDRTPDIMAVLDLTQSWGTAHAAVVAHNYNIVYQGVGVSTTGWGFAAIGGIGFNLPQLGTGDVVKFQGAYSEKAIGYSGFTTAGWDYSSGLNINGNGEHYSLQDAVGDGAGNWSYPTTWSIAAEGEFHLTPQFAIDPIISYGEINWSNRGTLANLEGNATSWLAGANFAWTPVTNLSFNLNIIYQATHSDTSGTWVGQNVDGWNGRIIVERDF
jgi:hypothetical protein